MPTLDYITAVAAFGGLLLGLWAAWRTFLDDRIKLRVTARLKRLANRWVVDGEIYEFVAVSVTNMSRFSVALASVDLILEDGAERELPGVFGAIDPRRRKALRYALLEKNRTDQLGDMASENVLSCRVRTECGRVIVKPVRGR